MYCEGSLFACCLWIVEILKVFSAVPGTRGFSVKFKAEIQLKLGL